MALRLRDRWLRYPQTLWVRRAIFQVHLWAGIGIGIYVFVVSASGSVLVYRNELYAHFSPKPLIVSGGGTPMSVERLTEAARRRYPTFDVGGVRTGETPNHALEVTLVRGDDRTLRFFHPFTGEDLGSVLPAGYRGTQWLLDLHDNLLNGTTGRRVNGAGAIALMLLSVTGAIVWWPGIKTWRRSMSIDLRSGWKRLNWSLHSALGFWCWAFMVMWAITGAYLAFPQTFGAIFDYMEPFDENNPAERMVDQIQYWLGYLHFGRLGGRGIPGCGRGLCDATTKLIWAAVGLVPPVLFVTGAVMWWNRVAIKRLRESRL
ncbi:MAG: hypothetical protein GEU82_01205 [Luteitalea sp.]|nr:hypothetical protein [Luteitalea sp.]